MINLIKKSGERKARGLFVIEGQRMFREIPPERLKKVYVSERFAVEHRETLQKIPAKILETVAEPVMQKMSDTRTPQGILSVVEMLNYNLIDILSPRTTAAGKKQPLLVVLEHLQDPGNLGTILRTAEGAGATGLVMSADTVDIYNPKVVRSTMGSLFRMPFVYVEDLHDAIDRMQEKNIRVCAAHLNGAYSDYYEEDFRQPTAFLIGNEGNGLTQETAKLADCLLKIPMEGELESLNAAVSTAVLLYESKRQRSRI